MSNPYEDKQYSELPYKVRGNDECLMSNPYEGKQGHQEESKCWDRTN